MLLITHNKSLSLLKVFIVAGLILLLLSCENDMPDKIGSNSNWDQYLGDNYSSQYSHLSQINRSNIKDLEKAWEFHTGDDISGDHTQIQCNPIIIDEILYGTTPEVSVFALDASTGKKLWDFDPNPNSQSAENVNRGITYWKQRNDKRILFTSGPKLYAISAETGKLISTFGDGGFVSLKAGLGANVENKYVVSTSPGVIFENLIIMGSRVSENAGSAPGYIQAFDVITGDLKWTFRTIPRPGDFGYGTWPPNAYKDIGGVNSWCGMSLDSDKGIVYVPTGSPAFDFWGGDRKGSNLFANCILALDAKTGKRIWHFQTVHHDLWDKDLPAPPNLFTFQKDGKKIDALAQITKSGYVFILDRNTGEPLFPIVEKPVPPSSLVGESAFPTQPIPQLPPPFMPVEFTKEDITNISPESHEYVSRIFNKVKNGFFAPPSTEGTIIYPGFDGGAEWGGAALDPLTSTLYVNSNIMPWILTMVKLEEDTEKIEPSGKLLYNTNCAVCHGIEKKGNSSGTYPSLVGLKEKSSREETMAIISEGKGFMPSFMSLDTIERQAIIDYLFDENQNFESHLQGIENNALKVPYTHTGYNRFLDQNGYPAIKPPWGTMTAIDLNKGSIKWQKPLGEVRELKDRGIPQTGTENYGGPVVTAGGLLFIGASKDGFFRAFDKDTGEELWKYKLPAGGYATPSVYMAGGKQYVVIACGGGKMGTHSGDSYVAFTLK